MSILDNEGHDPQGFMNTGARVHDEITAMQREIERLRAALIEITNFDECPDLMRAFEIARDALKTAQREAIASMVAESQRLKLP